jgi:hypothetical protein
MDDEVGHHRLPPAGVDDDGGAPPRSTRCGRPGDQRVVPVDEHHVGARHEVVEAFGRRGIGVDGIQRDH